MEAPRSRPREGATSSRGAMRRRNGAWRGDSCASPRWVCGFLMLCDRSHCVRCWMHTAPSAVWGFPPPQGGRERLKQRSERTSFEKILAAAAQLALETNRTPARPKTKTRRGYLPTGRNFSSTISPVTSRDGLCQRHIHKRRPSGDKIIASEKNCRKFF